ncbi:MAG TPA: hypothetical protein VF519_13270 [Mycobacteriales bacterium]
MGCYVCGTRQTDPARGASPWQRGVVHDVQVLGCPACQASGAWARVLDTCAACGSTALVRRLGETVCRACGHSGGGVAAADAPPPAATRPLGDDVAAALDRMFRQLP